MKNKEKQAKLTMKIEQVKNKEFPYTNVI